MSTLQNVIPGTGHEPSLQVRREGQAGHRSPGENDNVPVVQEDGAVHGIEGRIPSVEECRLTEFAETIQKQSISTMNDFLGKIVTLATALIGGGIALLIAKERPLPGQFIYWFFVILLVSLLASLYGLMPTSHRFDNTVSDLRNLETSILAKKQLSIYTGTALFALAIVVAIVGFIVQTSL